MVERPLIAHVIFRLDIGGLENGLVNLINGMTEEPYRHVIVCIDRCTDFSRRIRHEGVEIVEIHKRPGMDLSALWRLYRVFRRLRPDILHTRNIAALDALLPAFLAGVRCRIHSEHGWDVNDLNGRNRKLRVLRRLHSPLVHRYIALSEHLKQYLVDDVGIAEARVGQLYNGVDTDRFRPRKEHSETVAPPELCCDGAVLIGTVGRLQPVKDPLSLVAAFARSVRESRDFALRARLVMVGDGSLWEAARRMVDEQGIAHLTWMPGRRDDVDAILRSLDVFVLPSLAEGISNTILEAMASGLPVIATDVGGNAELVENGRTGRLVPPADIGSLAAAMQEYVKEPELRAAHGKAGAARAGTMFSLRAMIDGYTRLYGSMHAVTARDRQGVIAE